MNMRNDKNRDIISLNNVPHLGEDCCSVHRREETVVHPESKIILMDGRTIDCFPMPDKSDANCSEHIVSLDKTSEYFIHKRPALAPSDTHSDTEKEKENRELFLQNAFFLLSMKDRILSDSRLFLTKVPIINGLAYSGTSGFQHVTLGAYIEWWSNFSEVNFTDENGKQYLVCKVSGSPLSGSNICTVATKDGEYTHAHLKSFLPVWTSLMAVNTRYTEAKQIYQAYTLREAINILKSNTNI